MVQRSLFISEPLGISQITVQRLEKVSGHVINAIPPKINLLLDTGHAKTFGVRIARSTHERKNTEILRQ